MNDIVWITMRRMRTPLIVLILIYFMSVFAMVLVPGMDEAGRPVHMSFLDAAYFIAILSTTIGFGEVPFPFTNAQRMLVFIIILPNVVAWLYAIGTILRLFLDPKFTEVLARSKFKRQMAWVGKEFYIVCGFGSTGSGVVGGLLNRGYQAVVLERDPDLVANRRLEDRFHHVPVLACDTTHRENLELAGMHRPECKGMIVTTNDDHDNLTIAITSKLLEPRLPVLTRSEEESISKNMESFGTEYVINPFAIFAERLFLALASPIKYLVQDWLISVPGHELQGLVTPPSGHWIVCGAGRFGEQMTKQLDAAEMAYTVVELDEALVRKYHGAVQGRGTEAETLKEAGVMDSVGIIAGTENDIDNLSICMTARDINPNLFIVARQERQDNKELFDAFGPHLVARRSLIIARRILAMATNPLLRVFLNHLEGEKDQFAERTEAVLRRVLTRRESHPVEGDKPEMKSVLRAPHIWVADLSAESSHGAQVAREAGVSLTIRDLTTNSRTEEKERLACVCLLLERGSQRMFLPQRDKELKEGDRLLFAGRGRAEREMFRALHDPVLLWDAATVESMPRSAFWRAFGRTNRSG